MLGKALSPGTLAVLAPALLLTEAIIWAYCACKGIPYVRAKRETYRQLWLNRHAFKRSIASSRDSNHVLIQTLGVRLATEQLASGRIGVVVSVLNGILTAFYGLWRGIAIAFTWR